MSRKMRAGILPGTKRWSLECSECSDMRLLVRFSWAVGTLAATARAEMLSTLPYDHLVTNASGLRFCRANEAAMWYPTTRAGPENAKDL